MYLGYNILYLDFVLLVGNMVMMYLVFYYYTKIYLIIEE